MEKKTEENRGRLFGGLLLILIGLLALVGQFVDMEWFGLLILPAMGILFFAWGIITRQDGFMIPGGILSGLGLGTLLLTGPYEGASGETQGGLFMLAFAAGWALIPIVSTIFTKEKHLWALIPGAIFAIIGFSLLAQEMAALEYLGRIWPLFLILAGIYLIFRQFRSRS